MSNIISSFVFSGRNLHKDSHLEAGRVYVVGPLQLVKGLDQVRQYNNAIGHGTDAAVKALSAFAKQHKALEYAGKAVKFGTEHVNPLICASGVVKVAMSDDKVGAAVTEIGALAAMFAGESIFKDNYDNIAKKTAEKAASTKMLKPLVEYIEKSKMNGKVGTIVKGVLFVGTSIASYSAGQYLSKDLAAHVKANINLVSDHKENDGTEKSEKALETFTKIDQKA